MKCVNCGYEYFSQETLKGGTCLACGRSLTVRDEAYNQGAGASGARKPSGETSAEVQLGAQVSSAINVRRIALVLILAMILSVGSVLLSLVISVFLTDEYGGVDVSAARILLGCWLFLAAIITIVGLYYIIFDKRLSKLESARRWR